MSAELKQILEAIDVIGQESKQYGAKIQELEEKGGNTAEIVEIKGFLKENESKFNELFENYKQVEAEVIQLKKLRDETEAPKDHKSMGQQFVDSEEFKSFADNGGRGTSKIVEIKTNITTDGASAGALQDPTRDPTVYRSVGGYRPLRMADIIPHIPVSTTNVEIMRQNGYTNNAAPQAGEFASKAESAMTWELVNKPIQTIAHFVPASRQALSDAPILRSLIDTQLDYGLDLELDNQILNGDGTGQNFLGFLNDTDINDAGDLTGVAVADKAPAMIALIRAAVTLCQASEYYNINGVVLNPLDWAEIETATGSDGHYILVPFAASAAEATQIWRVPVIVTNACPVDSFVLGDWTLGAKLYDNGGTEIRSSDSHSDFFIKNAVAVLAEKRCALGINEPLAFTKGSFAGTV